MPFPLKLKNNTAAGRWLVVAGLIMNVSVDSVMKMNNIVHQKV